MKIIFSLVALVVFPLSGASAQVGIVDITSETQIWHDVDQTTTRIVGPKVHYGNGAVVPLQVRKCSLFGLQNPPAELSELFDKVEVDPTPRQQRMLEDLSLWQCTAGLCAEQKILAYKELFCSKSKSVALTPRMAQLKVLSVDPKIDPDGALNYLKDLQTQIGNLNFSLAKSTESDGEQIRRTCQLFGFLPPTLTQEIVTKIRSHFRPVRPDAQSYAPIEFVSFSPEVHQRSAYLGANGEFAGLARNPSHRIISGVYCGAQIPRK
jgi:hypothetical protein